MEFCSATAAHWVQPETEIEARLRGCSVY